MAIQLDTYFTDKKCVILNSSNKHIQLGNVIGMLIAKTRDFHVKHISLNRTCPLLTCFIINFVVVVRRRQFDGISTRFDLAHHHKDTNSNSNIAKEIPIPYYRRKIGCANWVQSLADRGFIIRFRSACVPAKMCLLLLFSYYMCCDSWWLISANCLRCQKRDNTFAIFVHLRL